MPPRVVIWLLWWLSFRLMFLSGMVKLLSGDPAWGNFSALTYHYETQPLPTVFGWYAHRLPFWAHVMETGGMYTIELVMGFRIEKRQRGGGANAILSRQALAFGAATPRRASVLIATPLLSRSAMVQPC